MVNMELFLAAFESASRTYGSKPWHIPDDAVCALPTATTRGGAPPSAPPIAHEARKRVAFAFYLFLLASVVPYLTFDLKMKRTQLLMDWALNALRPLAASMRDAVAAVYAVARIARAATPALQQTLRSSGPKVSADTATRRAIEGVDAPVLAFVERIVHSTTSSSSMEAAVKQMIEAPTMNNKPVAARLDDRVALAVLAHVAYHLSAFYLLHAQCRKPPLPPPLLPSRASMRRSPSKAS